jgi:hypothetical protein
MLIGLRYKVNWFEIQREIKKQETISLKISLALLSKLLDMISFIKLGKLAGRTKTDIYAQIIYFLLLFLHCS